MLTSQFHRYSLVFLLMLKKDGSDLETDKDVL